ncbi:MAG: hypothetical protein IPJ98_11085 [Bryobacterales bacterium]|nr:hypothetical protein [Bryobacterales bacterium]
MKLRVPADNRPAGKVAVPFYHVVPPAAGGRQLPLVCGRETVSSSAASPALPNRFRASPTTSVENIRLEQELLYSALHDRRDVAAQPHPV